MKEQSSSMSEGSIGMTGKLFKLNFPGLITDLGAFDDFFLGIAKSFALCVPTGPFKGNIPMPENMY